MNNPSIKNFCLWKICKLTCVFACVTSQGTVYITHQVCSFTIGICVHFIGVHLTVSVSATWEPGG